MINIKSLSIVLSLLAVANATTLLQGRQGEVGDTPHGRVFEPELMDMPQEHAPDAENQTIVVDATVGEFATCPKTPDALLLVKQCRFFSEIMGVQPKKSTIHPPRSLIVAVTVFCKVPDAQETFTQCVEETFRSTDCPVQTKNQLSALSGEYWKRYCSNVDDNIQTLNYLFSRIPVHLVDEQWEVGMMESDLNDTLVDGMCVSTDDLQDLVINPCARWYNRVIGSGSRDRALDLYVNIASQASDVGLQCVKRRMMRSTSCNSDLVYLMLRALYVFQGLPGVSIPLVYLDPSFSRHNPEDSTCPRRTVVGLWSNQFVKSFNRGVRYCPMTSGATDLLTTDTIEIVGILNVDQGVTSVDIRFYNPTDQHEPIVWYKASNGQLPSTFTSAITQQAAISIEQIHSSSIPTDTDVIKITDAGIGQMAIYVSVRNARYYDIVATATDFDYSYATGLFVHSCSKQEDIDYKAEVVNLQNSEQTGQFADACQDSCRYITTIGYHESCLIACMRRGGDSRIVNSINMLLGFDDELRRVCNFTQHAAPVDIRAGAAPESCYPLVGLIIAAVSFIKLAQF